MSSYTYTHTYTHQRTTGSLHRGTNNSITILKLNLRFQQNYTSMVKVLPLNQEHYFLYIFQGRAGTQFFVVSPLSFAFSFLFLSPFVFSLVVSFPLIFSHSLFLSRNSEGKYFGHVVPIVLSQMPELAGYALSAPL